MSRFVNIWRRSSKFITHVVSTIHSAFHLMDEEQGLSSVRQQKCKTDPSSCLEFCFHSVYTHTALGIWVDVGHFAYWHKWGCGLNPRATKCNMIMLRCERITLSTFLFTTYHLRPWPQRLKDGRPQHLPVSHMVQPVRRTLSRTRMWKCLDGKVSPIKLIVHPSFSRIKGSL